MKQLVKRYIAIGSIVMLLILTVLLSGCGYNRIMREHFSNPDNYFEFEIEVTRIYFYDGDKQYDERFVDITCSSDVDLDSADIFYIDGKVLDGNYDFIDGTYYENRNEVQFELSYANVLHLLSTEFYDVVKNGDCLNIRSTMWVYGDREWQYLAEIKLGDTVYLGFAEGLQNIIDYANAHKGL